jgi:hypothetical protein
MAMITFETKNRMQSGSNTDFPQFKLVKGERARVALIENPVFGWTHTIRAPKVVDGQVQYQMIQRKDGTQFEAPVKEWLGTHRCKGDDGIITGDGRGLDAKNCPMCAVAKANPSKMDAPKRRFAVHVVKYNTKPGTYDLTDAPFSVNIFVWKFTEFLFDKLIGINSIVGSLQNRDLLLGPCTDAQMQKYDINYDMQAFWSGTDQYKELTLSTLKSNRAEDLMAYVARDSELRWIEKDLDTLADAYRALEGRTDEPRLAAAELPSLGNDLNALMEDTKPAAKPQAAAPKTEEKVGFDSLLDI